VGTKLQTHFLTPFGGGKDVYVSFIYVKKKKEKERGTRKSITRVMANKSHRGGNSKPWKKNK